MKKLLSLFLVLGLGIALISGCSSTSSGGGTTVPEADAAAGVGQAARGGVVADSFVTIGTGVTPAGVGATQTFTNITREADWFHATTTYDTGLGFSLSEDFYFKVWDNTDTEVTNPSQLNASLTVNKIQMYGTFSYSYDSGSGDYSVTIGNGSSAPLIVIYSSPSSLDGQITYTASYQGESFQISYDYGELTTGANGIPTTGTVSWGLTVNSAQQYAGIITFNGTTTAELLFTSGGTGTYSINLNTGVVTAL